MKKFGTFFALLVILFLITTNGYAKSKVVEKSSGVHCGVRYYMGQLPSDIIYESLGEIEARGHGGMAVEVLMNSVLALCVKAKTMGANAVINVKWGEKAKGEAIIAKSFPDEYAEEDFRDFKGPTEYSKSKVFKHSYDAVFWSIIKILENELYDIKSKDYDKGIIETVPMEMSNGKRGAMQGGPYPIMKLMINIKDNEDGTTEVTENYILIKGKMWDDSLFKKSNEIFFRDIKKKARKIKL